MEGGFEFCSRRVFRVWCRFKLMCITLMEFLKTETDTYIHISHFIFYIDFVYGLCDHTIYDFISCLMVLFMQILMCCGKNSYYVYNVHGLYSYFMVFTSQSFIPFHDLVLVLVCWLFTFLLMNFQTKIYKKPIPFFFLFWDCTSLFLL